MDGNELDGLIEFYEKDFKLTQELLCDARAHVESLESEFEAKGRTLAFLKKIRGDVNGK